MALDDREKTFEKALTRNLRANAPAGADSPTHPCADAEILAAYHERLLAPEEMISWKGHIAGCSRCQAVLMLLEGTDQIPASLDHQKEQEHDVLLISAPTTQASPSIRSGEIPVAARTGASVLQKKKHPAPARHLRWLAPAGALAAGLLLWVSVRETTQPKLLESKPIEIADNRPQAAMPKQSGESASGPAAASPVPQSSSNQSEPSETQNSLKSRADNSTAKPDARMLDNKSESRARTQAQPQLKRDLSAYESSRPNRDTREESSASPQSSAEAKDLPLQGRNNTDLSALTPPAAPSAPSTSSQSVVITTPELQAKISKKAKTPNSASGALAATAPPQEAVDAMSRSPEASAPLLRVSNIQSPVTIFAPGHQVLWRAGQAGILEHSSDAGATWASQTSGVSSDLVAGSAPSDKVCWIVGHAGSIIQTIDGGAHWIQIHSPVIDDLDAVLAISAWQATVSDATNHRHYKTTDRGATWTQIAE
jgi:hypothetical protein